MQQVSRWMAQFVPFYLLLLIVFIRQHLQGFFVTIYVTAFLFKSNDILQKQKTLKWYKNDDLCYPLFMVPPRAIPPFRHAIFMIIVNGMILLFWDYFLSHLYLKNGKTEHYILFFYLFN
ncbi:hypothetical protein Hanom_Chr10g00934471 [Helianthus anomalus]